MAHRGHTRSQSFSSSQPPPSQKLKHDPVIDKTAHSTVSCVYQTHIGGFWRNVTVLWSKNPMNNSLSISVDSMQSDHNQTCKIDFKPWHFWAKKGYKTFEVDGNQLDTYWDLRSAKFSGSPEPCKDFYVALVSDEEVVLLVGDFKKKAYKRTKSRPALVDAALFSKKRTRFRQEMFLHKSQVWWQAKGARDHSREFDIRE